MQTFFSCPALLKRCRRSRCFVDGQCEEKDSDGWQGLRVVPWVDLQHYSIMYSERVSLQARVEKKEMGKEVRWRAPRHSTEGRSVPFASSIDDGG
jgi:hypothetical protein